MKSSSYSPWAAQAASLKLSIARHPRRIMAGIGALLLGTGVTAFGIAPLAPDASQLPVRQVVEALDTGTEGARIEILPASSTPWVLYRTDSTRSDDTLQSLLTRLGINDPAAITQLRNTPHIRQIVGRSGRLVHAEANERQELQRLTARWANADGKTFQRLVVESTPQGLQSRLETGTLTASARLGSGVIRSSLFAATDAAGIPDSVAIQLAEMFSSDIDFRRDLRQGDRFTVVYESLEADGEPMTVGRVLSAEFINGGRAFDAVWFEAPGHKGGYYNFAGESARRFYLSSPLEFSRVSSGYGMRFHPVTGQHKAHLGVDYAAPTGTPVRTVGDGTVEFAGVQGGYGNVIYVRHRNNQVTVYAHLSRIFVRKGQRVDQGERIGAVGSTGVSTGPHLHFEFRDNGQHRDPLVIARQSEAIRLPAELRPAFEAVAQQQRITLEAAANLQQASAQ
ncbi:M23 family metallopeptidase [Hydrogenophaga sp. IBVHS2]|uniref:M23 family metallopeptidase n=1 Tax=Hydrogenophaga sp. IBVHS2 TaxID=1985170 RepID=UPI00211A55F1|nr:M23 family metallopeptidase [Hydrogenophaga sp. IBVHS2]